MARKKAVRRVAGADEVRVEHLVATMERVGRMLDAVCEALKSLGPETTVIAARGRAASRLSSKKTGIVIAGFSRVGGCRQDLSCRVATRIKPETAGPIK